MTNRAASPKPSVRRASPTGQPPSRSQASASPGPAARWIAPHTPPPGIRNRFAALTIASTASVVISTTRARSTTALSRWPDTLPEVGLAAGGSAVAGGERRSGPDIRIRTSASSAACTALRHAAAREHHDGRPVRVERRVGWTRRRLAEFLAEEWRGVTVKPGRVRLGHPPRRVAYLVLQRPTGAPARITPIMLGDEFRLRRAPQRKEGRADFPGDSPALPAPMPGVAHLTRPVGREPAKLDRVGHRNAAIRFPPGEQGNPCDPALRHQLANEHHAPAPAAVRRAPPDVEAQVDLVEIAVEGNREAEDPGVEEAEPDQAHQGEPIPCVELGAPRYQRAEEAGAPAAVGSQRR